MTHDTASPQEGLLWAPAEQIVSVLHEVLRPVAEGAQTPGQGRGRPRVLQADHLWLALLVAILRGGSSCARVWRLITWTGVGSFPVLDLTRAAVRKRLMQADLTEVQDLLRRVSVGLLAWTTTWQDASLVPFAHTVLALDQSTLEAVRRTCQDVREEGTGSARLLVGQLAGLFDLRRQQWVRLLFREDVFANEKHFVQELFAGIQPGTLIVADLGYFSFQWFDWLSDQGCWWLSRVREKTSYEVVHAFVEQGQTLDALVWLGRHRADHAKHLVRLIQFEHAGICYQYLTNIRDPQLLSMREAAALYARRWDIELAFKALKGDLGIHLWWSAEPRLVLVQLLCALILAQILHALHLRVAAEAGVDLFEVSFPVLVSLLASAPARQSSEDLVTVLLRKGREQGLIRPSRRYGPVVPALLEPYRPAPAGLLVLRQQRYGHRKCQARSDRVCFQPRFDSFFLL